MLPYSTLVKLAADSRSLRERIAAAEAATGVPASHAQIEAGNYPKGKYVDRGLLFTIETAKGTTRSGMNKTTGKPWSITLKNSYGYINRTRSAEKGDQMDFFIGPCPESEVVFVIDQNKADGKTFDEHKCVFGCWSSAEAIKLYHDNYSAGWNGFRACTPLTFDQFKQWLRNGDMDKPCADQRVSEFTKQAKLVDTLVPTGAEQFLTNLGEASTGLKDLVKAVKPKLHTVPDSLADIAEGMRLLRRSGPSLMGTALGGLTGYGLGSLISDNSDPDPAAREQYRKMRLLTTMLGAAGGGFAGYQGGPLLTKKAEVNWRALGQAVRKQAPGLHIPDMAAGALAGGIPAYLLSYLSKDKTTRRSALKNALMWGLLGAGGANLAGDRVRRYISNLPGAFDYNAPQMIRQAQLHGLKGFWKGGILDQQLEQHVRPELANRPGAEPNPKYWDPATQEGMMTSMRRELFRRGLNVHSETPDDYFERTGTAWAEGKMRDKVQLASRLFTKGGRLNEQGKKAWEVLSGRYQLADDTDGRPFVPYSLVLGNYPVERKNNTYRLSDVWDFALSPMEQKLRSSLLQRMFTGRLRSEETDDQIAERMKTDMPGTRMGDLGQYAFLPGTKVLRSLMLRSGLEQIAPTAPKFEQVVTQDVTGPRFWRERPVPKPDDESIGKMTAVATGLAAAGLLGHSGLQSLADMAH